MANINIEKLNDFNDLIDGIIEDIESGKTKANPLKPVTKTVAEIDAEELTLNETATETGEEVFDFDEAKQLCINDKVFSFCEEGEVNGRPGKRLISVSNHAGVVLFGSAAVASRETGWNPTTIRVWCNAERVDAEGNTWSYQDNETL